MKREKATELVTDLLGRVSEGDEILQCITEVWLFGSYARGALEPGDVDLDIEYRAEGELLRIASQRLASGGDYLAPLRQRVVGRRRGLQVTYGHRETLARTGIEMQLLWRRGEPLSAAMGRLAAIKPDPEAGTAARDAMLPAFMGLDQWIPRVVRMPLVEWEQAGAITVEHIVIPDATPRDRRAQWHATERWKESSPMRRAGLAALAYVEAQGGDPRAVHLHGFDVDKEQTPHFVGFSWRYFDAIAHCLVTFGGEEWIEVIRPTRTKQLDAIRIVPLDRERLAGEAL